MVKLYRTEGLMNQCSAMGEDGKETGRVVRVEIEETDEQRGAVCSRRRAFQQKIPIRELAKVGLAS